MNTIKTLKVVFSISSIGHNTEVLHNSVKNVYLFITYKGY